MGNDIAVLQNEVALEFTEEELERMTAPDPGEQPEEEEFEEEEEEEGTKIVDMEGGRRVLDALEAQELAKTLLHQSGDQALETEGFTIASEWCKALDDNKSFQDTFMGRLAAVVARDLTLAQKKAFLAGIDKYAKPLAPEVRERVQFALSRLRRVAKALISHPKEVKERFAKGGTWLAILKDLPKATGRGRKARGAESPAKPEGVQDLFIAWNAIRLDLINALGKPENKGKYAYTEYIMGEITLAYDIAIEDWHQHQAKMA